MKPVCVINNITIATVDDITILSDDINIYAVDLSGTINLLVTCFGVPDYLVPHTWWRYLVPLQEGKGIILQVSIMIT